VALAGPTAARGSGNEIHTVHDGHTLGKIAKRYNVAIEALCNANGIPRNAPIKPGQKLVIPNKADKSGDATRQLLEQGKFRERGVGGPAKVGSTDRESREDLTAKRGRAEERTKEEKPRSQKGISKGGDSWKRYVRPARRKGYVTLKATGRHFSGYAIVEGNRIASRAKTAFRRVLYSWRTGTEHDIDPRLIRLLTEVSDKFGGRTLRVASGYREQSFARESKHKLGRACDFTVEGVPNEALRDYLLTRDGVGVGYYPNSSFVHLDVRPTTTTWTDFSKPGERPRKQPRAASEAGVAEADETEEEEVDEGAFHADPRVGRASSNADDAEAADVAGSKPEAASDDE
jgi:LysM repeat protein